MINFVRPGMWKKDEFKAYFADPIKEGFKIDSTEKEIQFMKQRSFVLVEVSCMYFLQIIRRTIY